jgi:hypothetical protein
VKFIEGMLIYFGRKGDMSNTQIENVVRDIMDKYYYFRLEDIALCFKRARQNPVTYGKLYNHIDGSIILGWLSKYDKERDEVLHSFPADYKPPTFTEEKCSREEYVEILQARIAGGDLYANELLQRFECIDKTFFSDRFEYGNYKYQRKHKFDDKK